MEKENGVKLMDFPSPKLWESPTPRRQSISKNYQDSTMKNHDLILALSWISVPLILFIASQNYTLGVVTGFIIPVILMAINSSSVIKSSSTIKVFLKGWTCSSFFTQLCIFQLETVGYLEILFYENALLTALIACSCYYVFQAKYIAQTNYKIIKKEALNTSTKWNCANCTHNYSHHYYVCSWLNICIIRKNFKYFSYFLIFLSLACFYAANLTLTTVCYPKYLFGNYFLVPYNCSDAYRDIHASLSFTSAAYFILIGLYSIYLLLLNTVRFFMFRHEKQLPT